MPEMNIDNIDELQNSIEQYNDQMKDYLDSMVNRSNSLVAIRSVSGGSISYISAVKSKWISNNVSLFVEMPSASHIAKQDEDGNWNFVLDDVNVNEVKQRKPDFSRSHILALYLLSQEHAQFPPFLVVVEDDWVTMKPDDDDYHEYWDENRRAKQSVIKKSFSFAEDNMFLERIQFGRSNCYVIDGSHRTIAINQLANFAQYGTLEKRGKDGDRISATFSTEQVAEITGASVEAISMAKQRVMNTSFGIQFFSAVENGETIEEATRRIRSLFVHINKTAKPPTGSENVLLDDDNGFAIAARRAGFSHSLFAKSESGDLIDYKKPSLPVNSVKLTSIGLLKEVTEDYLSTFDKFTKGKWSKTGAKQIALRPDDAEIDEAVDLMDDFFDRVQKLPLFQKIHKTPGADRDVFIKDKDGNIEVDPDTGKKLKQIAFIKIARRFYDPKIEDSDENSPNNLGHLLMRPIGQRILARAVGQCVNDADPISLDLLFKKLTKLDKQGKLSNFNQPSNALYGVVYNPTNNKMEMKNRILAVKVLMYILGGILDVDTLREEYAIARTIGDGLYYSGDGTIVNSAEEIELPTTVTA